MCQVLHSHLSHGNAVPAFAVFLQQLFAEEKKNTLMFGPVAKD
jgi:hypothetical protein